MLPYVSLNDGPLEGVVSVPGDKSISHRALMMGALAIGETRIAGLLESEDIRHLRLALQDLIRGPILKDKDGSWRLWGVGPGGMTQAERVIYLGNSATSARLLMGILASQGFMTFLDGDSSLNRRPMERVIKPLTRMGAKIVSRQGCLPLLIQGTEWPVPIAYPESDDPVSHSAQVKSAVLLAGLNTPGVTAFREPLPTRDHTERLFQVFGIPIEIGQDDQKTISVQGEVEFQGQSLTIPGDFSSAAFLIVAALICPGSRLTLQGVGLNPLRIGLLESLWEMGADISVVNRRERCHEAVGDLEVRFSSLKGVVIPAERSPRMIDEYPILAVAAAAARGPTTMQGLSELKVKESDRLARIAHGLSACGVKVETSDDDTLIVFGSEGSIPGAGMIQTDYDHRIAMSFLILGLAAREAVTVDDISPIQTSFPDFIPLMTQIGASFSPAA